MDRWSATSWAAAGGGAAGLPSARSAPTACTREEGLDVSHRAHAAAWAVPFTRCINSMQSSQTLEMWHRVVDRALLTCAGCQHCTRSLMVDVHLQTTTLTSSCQQKGRQRTIYSYQAPDDQQQVQWSAMQVNLHWHYAQQRCTLGSMPEVSTHACSLFTGVQHSSTCSFAKPATGLAVDRQLLHAGS